MELWGETPLQVPLNTRLSELLHNRNCSRDEIMLMVSLSSTVVRLVTDVSPKHKYFISLSNILCLVLTVLTNVSFVTISQTLFIILVLLSHFLFNITLHKM